MTIDTLLLIILIFILIEYNLRLRKNIDKRAEEKFEKMKEEFFNKVKDAETDNQENNE